MQLKDQQTYPLVRDFVSGIDAFKCQSVSCNGFLAVRFS